MIKNIIRSLILLSLSVGMTPIWGLDGNNGTLTYTYSVFPQLTITGCLGECPEILTIPDQIYGEQVVSISDSAFVNQSGLVVVNLPDSLTTIGSEAFSGSGILSIEIPDSVTSIGNEAFKNTSLTSIKLPSNLTTVRSGLFQGVTGVTEIVLPDTITDIGSSAFRDMNLAGLGHHIKVQQ